MEKKIINRHQNILAIDEAGRGSLAGPLAVGGVYLTSTKIRKLCNANIKFIDSKILDHQERLLFLKIIKYFRLKTKVILINNKIIDKIGINNAFILASQKLIKIFKPKSLIIDGLPLPIKTKKRIYFFVKGDQKLSSLAAASIVAKTYRDKYMIKISKKYHYYLFEKHKGYGTKDHLQKLKTIGPAEIHRQSFLKNYLTKMDKL